MKCMTTLSSLSVLFSSLCWAQGKINNNVPDTEHIEFKEFSKQVASQVEKEIKSARESQDHAYKQAKISNYNTVKMRDRALHSLEVYAYHMQPLMQKHKTSGSYAAKFENIQKQILKELFKDRKFIENPAKEFMTRYLILNLPKDRSEDLIRGYVEDFDQNTGRKIGRAEFFPHEITINGRWANIPNVYGNSVNDRKIYITADKAETGYFHSYIADKKSKLLKLQIQTAKKLGRKISISDTVFEEGSGSQGFFLEGKLFCPKIDHLAIVGIPESQSHFLIDPRSVNLTRHEGAFARSLKGDRLRLYIDGYPMLGEDVDYQKSLRLYLRQANVITSAEKKRTFLLMNPDDLVQIEYFNKTSYGSIIGNVFKRSSIHY